MESPLIEFRDVSKEFDGRNVLSGVDLTIYRRQVTAIIGKSGTGKSVLLKHIIGLLTPDSGQILFEGRPLGSMTRAERRAMKMKCSYMFQGTALFDSMTVYDNIALPLKERLRLKPQVIRRRVMEKMNQLDIAGIESRYPSQLSGGMQKRVAMARALITDPEIVLFDEPTTGLDPVRRNTVFDMIVNDQQRFGFSAVLVSHDIPDIFFISQRIAMLDEGRMIFQGSCDQIRTSDHPVVRTFIGGWRNSRSECRRGPDRPG